MTEVGVLEEIKQDGHHSKKKEEFGRSNLHASENFMSKVKEHHERVWDILHKYKEVFGPLPSLGTCKKLVQLDLELIPRAHLVPSFILPELNIHLKMFQMKIWKLNLIHHAFIFSVILVPNLWLGACCRCRARVCRCFCLSPQLFAKKMFSQKICRTKNNFVVR